MSSKDEKFSVQDDNEFTDPSSIHDLGEEFLKTFCRKAVMSFFKEYGLVSHQINSYNEFIKNGLQTAFDSFGVTKGEGQWRYASMRFGQVTLDKPSFFAGERGDVQDMLPWHAKLQNMTYSPWMKVNVNFSGNFKTRREQFIQKEVLIEETTDIILGRIPLMVKSDLCWMKGAEKGDCDFDHGGYFSIKGAEKVSLKLSYFSLTMLLHVIPCGLTNFLYTSQMMITLKFTEKRILPILVHGIVELVGTEEEEDCCTAWEKPIKFIHCELDMSFLLGLSCGIIPSHLQTMTMQGWVLYQSQKHSPQAIGFPTTNPNIRVDTLLQQLFYPQRPLFWILISDCLGRPEDSLVMNQASLECGVFRSESYKAEVDNKDIQVKSRPSDDMLNFGKIQSKSGDIVIGKYAEIGADHSIKLKHTERGLVLKVLLSSNDDGKNFAVVSIRQSVHSACLGDKFSSMHGQKGVLGFLEQTPAQLLEAALGKGACDGLMSYATPFATSTVVRSLIFTWITFYQQFIHMSEDKVKFRNTGSFQPLTGRPVADRKRFGGIEFGEMKCDCLIAHGASGNLHERLFKLSDTYQMHLQKMQECCKCDPTSGGWWVQGPYCRICNSADDIIKANVPYGAKLLSQELSFSMGITLKFDTQLSGVSMAAV
ncbi:DNA-directed RNA polymerases IV and V subunit 2 [Citrus sinensis]|uniref:DNA-directed RNA polymerases IV and V subunit 2 n=1 Tax=Citrus sinensis TaxID=2711 RepID=A0ACB8NLL5_CITSI|nr:DNA-directed RNA polymerases IV and V subunit 2 [Citrus sinensis]KAH9798773.1 DNA-directed RNA polymerases IV and V subunit 2 [Citrus sinensis]